MMELFDMGKYDFFVWGSISVFLLALLVDFISAKIQSKNIKKRIKTQIRKTDARRKQT